MLSIIIPTYNEDSFDTYLAHVQNLVPLAQIIRVDSSPMAPEDRDDVTLVRVRRQERAYQMNAGVPHATHDTLLFLHADTCLPQSAPDLIEDFVKSGCDYAAFPKHFDHSHWMLRLIALTNNAQLKSMHVFLGDNGLLITKKAFAEIGGFPDIPLMEDVVLSKRLCEAGRTFFTLRVGVTTSARKFLKNGIFKTLFLMRSLRLQFLCGVHPAKLKKQYYGTDTYKLVLYAKYPHQGTVKTRLAKDIGDIKAVALYTGWVEDQIAAHNDQKYHLAISLNDHKDIEKFAILFGVEKNILAVQKGRDLGARMYNTLRENTQNGFLTLIAGTDIPSLTPEIVNEACLALTNHDIVLGPSHDGGYYLIGMKSVHKELFDKLQWSTDTVLDDTLTRIIESKLSYHILPTLRDIDTIDDLEAEGLSTE